MIVIMASDFKSNIDTVSGRLRILADYIDLKSAKPDLNKGVQRDLRVWAEAFDLLFPAIEAKDMVAIEAARDLFLTTLTR